VARHLKALTLGEGNLGHLDLPGPPDGWQGALSGFGASPYGIGG
jgi:hypothetical protein